ncbi:MAG: alpha/beta fold hydrolase [Thermosynechococcaceae cyanobacterium MS004]|nr:alpha/beta fold hydrolase [Thermosynechococcaceae cyanobacterium MS004]
MISQQRDWMWQGWQVRYAYTRPAVPPHQSQTAQSRSAPPSAPILFLHGFGGSIGHWRQNFPFFADHHPVYALDLLGFGASEKAPIRYSIDLWVQQVYEFWQTFIRRPMILVGNSIGSLTALALASAHPEAVQRLAMLSLPDPSVREDLIPLWCRPLVSRVEQAFTANWVLKPLFYWVRRPKVVRNWASLAYSSRAALTDELVEIFAAPARDRGAALAFSHILQAMIRPQFGPRVSAILPELELPILLIWGRQDRMVPAGFAKIFADLNPNLTLVELDEAGHCPHDECAEVVNQTLRDWIDSVQPARSSALNDPFQPTIPWLTSPSAPTI